MIGQWWTQRKGKTQRIKKTTFDPKMKKKEEKWKIVRLSKQMTDRMLIVYSESLLVIVFFSKLLECRLEKKDVGRFSFYTHTHTIPPLLKKIMTKTKQ